LKSIWLVIAANAGMAEMEDTIAIPRMILPKLFMIFLLDASLMDA
jgi:hypothetical protein